MALWWIANVVALVVVIPLVVVLATRVVARAREIRRYADDIEDHGAGLAEALAPVADVSETARLARAVAAGAGRYAAALERRL